MSGIYIPGMKMPKDGCASCAFELYGHCIVKANLDKPMDVTHSCPLIELPSHGRLGDLDALMAEFEQMQTLIERRGHEFACSFMSSGMEISTEWYCVEDAVNAAKTIIPADKEDTP